MQGMVSYLLAMTDAELLAQVNSHLISKGDNNQLKVLLARTILKKWNVSCDWPTTEMRRMKLS